MRYQILAAVTFLAAFGACADQATSPTAVTDVSPLLSAAAATRTEFEGFINFCESFAPDGVKITPGGTLHVQGARNRNEWVTGNPLVDGSEENVVDVNINRTGNGHAHLAVTVRPDAVDGTWEIRQTVEVIGGVPGLGRGVGHGTGELHGMTIKFTAGATPVGQSVCNPANPTVELRGIIISPAASG